MKRLGLIIVALALLMALVPSGAFAAGGGYTIIQLTDNEYDDYPPQIDAGLVVWRGYDAVGQDREIFLWDGTQTINLSDNDYLDRYPQIDAGQVVWHGGFSGLGLDIFLAVLPEIAASIDIDPDVLNVKGQGQWVTVYIELPADWDVADIDLTTVKLNGTVPAVTDPQYGFVTDPNSYITDNDGDGILERMVKFDRELVKQLVDVGEDLEEAPGGLEGEVQLTVSGKVAGTWFEGSSTVLVLHKGK